MLFEKVKFGEVGVSYNWALKNFRYQQVDNFVLQRYRLFRWLKYDFERSIFFNFREKNDDVSHFCLFVLEN